MQETPAQQAPAAQSTANQGGNNNADGATPQVIQTGPLSRQFESLLKNIRRTAEFVERDEFSALDFISASTRLERLESIWEKLNETYLQLIGQIGEERIDECENKLERAEDLYFIAVAAFRSKVTELSPQTNRVGTPSEAGGSEHLERPINVNVNLDHREVKNTWGYFDGSLLKWQSFHDRFVAKIHNDEKMSNVEKFSHLKNSLRGNAERTLGEWQLTEDSYTEAWERLNQIYDKKYPIIRAHLQQFERLPAITGRPSSNELQNLSNVTHETLRQLKAMQLPVESWDMVIVHNLHSRLDPETAKQWELQRSSETPTAQEMLAFLDKQASAALPMDKKGKPNLQVTVDNERAGTSNLKKSSSEFRSSTPTNGKNKGYPPCEACNGDHQLYYCDDYLSLSLSARWAFVRKRNLCANCLKKGHNADHCFQPYCQNDYCKERDNKHNSTLCPMKVGKEKPNAVRKASDASSSSKQQ